MGADGGISPWLGGFGSASQGQEGRKRCCGVWFVVVCWLAGWLPRRKRATRCQTITMRNETKHTSVMASPMLTPNSVRMLES